MSDVLTELTGGVLRLQVNREEQRNTLSPGVLAALGDGVRSATTDDRIRVVLISAVGDRVFCAGADLANMGTDATILEQHDGRGQLAKLAVTIRDCPVPVVARVQGLCLAGGVGLAAGCDIVLAAESAQFGLPEIDRGLWPFMVSALLARQVPAKHAMDWMLTGERFDARSAYAAGLVSRVFADNGFDVAVEAYVEKLAAAPPVAVRLGKAAWVAATESSSLPVALEAMQAQLSLLVTTNDVAEGIAAFFDRRPPSWTGR